MTTQISDDFFYNKQTYSILSGFILPGDFKGFCGMFGLNSLSSSKRHSVISACWRGYIATFCLDSDARTLVLSDVELLSFGDADLPAFNVVGSLGSKCILPVYPTLKYNGLRVPINYTGKLTIGNGYVGNVILDAPFPAPETYQNVLELSFSSGICTAICDVSEEIGKRRDALLYELGDIGDEDE